MTEREEPRRLRIVDSDEQQPSDVAGDPDIDPFRDLDDLIEPMDDMHERDNRIDTLFVAAFDSAEARLNPWLEPEDSHNVE